jgi:hypothetical protein
MGSHPDQNRLTQSLGGEAAPMPDFGSDAVKPHDAFLVCSDGLWETIPQAEMAATLAAKKLGDTGARHLAERAFDRARPKSDNITVALVRLGGPPPGGAADFDEAPTTRLPGAGRKHATVGARWGLAAATVVGLGAAAAVVYQPWETGTDAQPVAVPPRAPDTTAIPPPPVPQKPETEERREQREAQPPATPSPREPTTPQQGMPQQGVPDQDAPRPPTPPVQGDRGNNEKERPRTAPGDGEAKPGSGSDAPPRAPDPAPGELPKPPTSQ